jgi:hypothetical protein
MLATKLIELLQATVASFGGGTTVYLKVSDIQGASEVTLSYRVAVEDALAYPVATLEGEAE